MVKSACRARSSAMAWRVSGANPGRPWCVGMTCGGEVAALGFPVHPHQLRHACGYKLANAHQDTRAIQLYLGHRNIQHTVQYTEFGVGRFQDFWRDDD